MGWQDLPGFGVLGLLLLAEALLIGVEAEVVLVLDDFLSVVGLVSAEVDAPKAIHSDNTSYIGGADRDCGVPGGDSGLAATCLLDGVALPPLYCELYFPEELCRLALPEVLILIFLALLVLRPWPRPGFLHVRGHLLPFGLAATGTVVGIPACRLGTIRAQMLRSAIEIALPLLDLLLLTELV